MLPDMSARLTVHPLTPQDEADVLAFEREQRAFFRGAVGDRGERFFADYPAVHAALLAEARQGETLPLLVRDAAGALVGRVNFTALRPGPAWLGYRFAQEVQGRGYATAAVAQALTQARVVGVREVQARVALNNPASARVLEKLGFTSVQPQDSPETVERNGEPLLVQRFRLQLD